MTAPDPTPNRKDIRVRRRDRYSIEIKSRHLLDPDRSHYRRRRTTRTRLVFFIPYSFSIRPETFNPDEFYDDLKLYVRFNTPLFTLEHLVDPSSHDSPLARLTRLLEESPTHPDRIAYEARLLGTVVKAVLRDETAAIAGSDLDDTERTVAIAGIVERIDGGVQRFRDAMERAEAPDVREQLGLVDEYVSLTIEDYLVRLLARIGSKNRGDAERGIRALILEQQRYRSDRGYRSVVAEGQRASRREEYIYRYKRLKHYVSAVLFFAIRRGNQAKRVDHVLYALAAGIAMAIATAFAYFGQIRFGRLSSALFLVLVGSYMIKDRIKDAFRAAFHNSLGRLFFDRRTVFVDTSTRRPLGVVKERTMFVPQRRLKNDLLEARARGGFETAITSTSPESVLEYTKVLHLFERRLHATHRRISGLADINIVDLKNLVRYLVRQQAYVPVLHDDSISLERTRRIYHLNLLVSVDTGGGPVWQKIRLVVDAGGIRRIELPEPEQSS